MQRLVIIGTSTTAQTVYSFVKKYNLFEVIGFAINRKYMQEDSFCGLPVYAIEDLENFMEKEKDFLFVAIQWNRLNADRRKVFEDLKRQGFKFANLISPTAVLNGKVVGENCWITDLVTVDFGTIIESNTFVKISVAICQNVKISPHCFIGAKSTIGGGAIIGEQSFIGLNATIFDCTQIGKKCIVGACAVVKRNMPDFSRCKTTSDSMDVKQYSEEDIESKLMFSKNVRTPVCSK